MSRFIRRGRQATDKKVPFTEKRPSVLTPGFELAKELAAFLTAAGAIAGINPLAGAGVAALSLLYTGGKWVDQSANRLRRTVLDAYRNPPEKRLDEEGQQSPDSRKARLRVAVLGDRAAQELAEPLQKILTERLGEPVEVISSLAEADSSAEAIRLQQLELRERLKDQHGGQRIHGLVIATGGRNILDGNPFDPADYRPTVNQGSYARPDAVGQVVDADVVIVTPSDFTQVVHNDPNTPLPLIVQNRYARRALNYIKELKEFASGHNRRYGYHNGSEPEDLAERHARKVSVVEGKGNLHFSGSKGFYLEKEALQGIANSIADKLEPGLRDRPAESALETSHRYGWGLDRPTSEGVSRRFRTTHGGGLTSRSPGARRVIRPRR